MAQYKTGTVSVTNGSATVTGTGTEFSSNLTAGNLFTVEGDNVAYTIASAPTATSLTLTAPYSGATATGQIYGVTIDFTPDLGLPLMSVGDLNTAAIYNEAMKNVDNEFNNLGTAAFADLTTSSTDATGVQRAQDLNRFRWGCGGVVGRTLASGNAQSATIAVFDFYGDWSGIQNSLTVTGSFRVCTRGGTALFSGLTVAVIGLSSARSERFCRIVVTGLSGLTVDMPLELRSDSIDAEILIKE